MRNPKRLNSRFPGTCHDCGARVESGDPILWLRKGVIVCADCDANGYDDAGQPIASATPATPTPDATGANPWAAALAWNDKAPAPGESIGVNPDATPVVTKPAKAATPAQPVIHLEDDGAKKPESVPAETKPETKPELPAARVLKTVQAERPELDRVSATVTDLLVTLVNAIDRLDVEQTESIAAHCLHFANDTASGSRRRIWQQLSRTIH